MHGNRHAAHQNDVVVEILLLIDQHLRQKDARILEMTVHHRCLIRTQQIRSIHAVHRVNDAMESGPKVADVPHPAQQWRDVDQARTEAEHGKQHGQNRSNEDGQLYEYLICITITGESLWSCRFCESYLYRHHDADEEAPALRTDRHHHAHQQEIVEPVELVIVSGQIVTNAHVQGCGEHLRNA